MISLILAAVGTFLGLFFWKKAGSATALLENLGVKTELNTKDKDIAKNQGLIEAEGIKQEEIQKEVEAPKETKTDEELANIFNNRK